MEGPPRCLWDEEQQPERASCPDAWLQEKTCLVGEMHPVETCLVEDMHLAERLPVVDAWLQAAETWLPVERLLGAAATSGHLDELQ